MVSPQRMEQSELEYIFNSLKPKQEVSVWFNSGVRSADDWTELQVGRKSKSKKYNLEKISLINPKNPKGSKYYLYNRQGRISFAMGDMGTSLIAIKTNGKNAESFSADNISVKGEAFYPSNGLPFKGAGYTLYVLGECCVRAHQNSRNYHFCPTCGLSQQLARKMINEDIIFLNDKLMGYSAESFATQQVSPMMPDANPDVQWVIDPHDPQGNWLAVPLDWTPPPQPTPPTGGEGGNGESTPEPAPEPQPEPQPEEENGGNEGQQEQEQQQEEEQGEHHPPHEGDGGSYDTVSAAESFSAQGDSDLDIHSGSYHGKRYRSYGGIKYETLSDLLKCKCGFEKEFYYPYGCYSCGPQAHHGKGHIVGFTPNGRIVWKDECTGRFMVDTDGKTDIDWFNSIHQCKGAESFSAPSHCASCGWNLVQVPIGTETKWGVAIEGNQYYYNHNACKGIGKLPIKAESFNAESQTRFYRNLGIGAALVAGLAYWFKK